MMRKIIPAVLFVLLLFVTNVSQAEPYLDYQVTDVQEHSFTIRRGNREITLNRDPKGLQVGDTVRYNKKKHILKRGPREL